MIYRIWMMGEEHEISPAPNTTYPDDFAAECAIADIERRVPELRGRLIALSEEE